MGKISSDIIFIIILVASNKKFLIIKWFLILDGYAGYPGYNGYSGGYGGYGGYGAYTGGYNAYPYNSYYNRLNTAYPYARPGYAGYSSYPSSYYTSNYANSIVGGGLGALGTPGFVPPVAGAAGYQYGPGISGTVY